VASLNNLITVSNPNLHFNFSKETHFGLIAMALMRLFTCLVVACIFLLTVPPPARGTQSELQCTSDDPASCAPRVDKEGYQVVKPGEGVPEGSDIRMDMSSGTVMFRMKTSGRHEPHDLIPIEPQNPPAHLSPNVTSKHAHLRKHPAVELMKQLLASKHQGHYALNATQWDLIDDYSHQLQLGVFMYQEILSNIEAFAEFAPTLFKTELDQVMFYRFLGNANQVRFSMSS
jgi:hypothetical protein